MSAVTLAPATVAEAHAALHMAVAAQWPQDIAVRKEIFSAVVILGCTLKGRQENDSGTDVTQAARAADELIHVMTRHCGPGWGNER